MPKIILKTGESLPAIQGSIGVVPFKCWDKNGSEAFKARILEHNASNAAFYVMGPVKGLISSPGRGGRHSARSKRGMSIAGRKGWKKYYSKVNVPQLVHGAHARRTAKQDES